MEDKNKNVTREFEDGKPVLKLCGVQGCCPSIRQIEGGYEIRDDHGGSVKLTQTEFEALQTASFNE